MVDGRRVHSTVDGPGVLDVVYDAMQEEWDQFRYAHSYNHLMIT